MLRRLVTLVLLLALLGLLWVAREPVLAAAGHLPVREDRLVSADLVVVLADLPVLCAVEAAEIVRPVLLGMSNAKERVASQRHLRATPKRRVTSARRPERGRSD